MAALFWRSTARNKSTEERAKKLREMLLKPGNSQRSSEESQKAIAYCEWCISEYEDWFDFNEARWSFWQKVTIVGGVAATLAGVITIPDKWIPAGFESFSWVRAVPAAIVTIAAGYLASFNYREDAVRHELTANALLNQLVKYQAMAEPYNSNNEVNDRSLFLGNISRLVESELHSWSTLVIGRNAESEKPAAKSDTTRAGAGEQKGDADQTPTSIRPVQSITG